MHTSEKKPGKHICAGILAHVDAGKTTLAEGILYLTGSIRRLGRVDHQDAFLDNFVLERERGITIFSKQAQIMLEDIPVTLMDTPGHVDFAAEMERTLGILDYAILVISAPDGVQGHVETLWRLLERYEIPVFLFVNKMDQPGTDRTALMQELEKRLDGRCMDFEPLVRQKEPQMVSLPEEFLENLAMSDEETLEYYLENGTIETEQIAGLISQRKVFPCYFGSALKMQGVEDLLAGMHDYMQAKEYGSTFGARVFKITRDAQGNRLTHMKITGGHLSVKDVLTNRKIETAAKWQDRGAAESRNKSADSAGIWEQKVNQIRIFSGSSFETVPQAEAGMVCAVTGLDCTYAGEGLGDETQAGMPLLEPVLSYRIELPPECDVHKTFLQMRQLEEEEPELHIVWEEQTGEIHAQLMGEVQIEVLKRLIRERFGIWVEFGEGNIVYKETIAQSIEGVGHFEPLRHYAEVHLLLEPAERGSGMQFETSCSEDVLEKNWQRLILTHLEEKQHCGVLTGSEITDMRITLIAGRAHQKHTEGGDFRQATYRAVRQGLRCAKSVLLEPVYEFRIEVPQEAVGRVMTDVQKMGGASAPPQMEGETAVICGSAPVVTMRGYQTELISYTKGRGRMTCTLKGYEPCHNAEEVIAKRGYDPEADLENPTGSVFCAHGAGYVVSWDRVRDYMHVESGWRAEGERTEDVGIRPQDASEKREEAGTMRERKRAGGYGLTTAEDKELEEIFARTYGSSKKDEGYRKNNPYKKSRRIDFSEGALRQRSQEKDAEEYLLVDGYNIIFAWEDLKELAKINIDAARDRLMDILSNYQGYKKCRLILVFDAYKVSGGRGEIFRYHNIHVVYTKEAETADQYIEKTVREIDRRYHVTVATSDALEQIIIFGAGAARLSAAGLHEEIEMIQREIRSNYLGKQTGGRNYLFDHLDDSMNELMEEVRLGKRSLDAKDDEEEKEQKL